MSQNSEDRSERRDIRLRPPSWNEVVGTIEEIGDESITLRITHVIHIAPEELARWTAKLRKGRRIGILVLDDRSIRVRNLGAGDDGA